MLHFSLLGFPVRVHWFFWINAALLGGALSASGPESLRRVAIWIAVVFASILIHELGHALVMRRFGDRQPQIILYAFGGLAIGGGWRTRREQILVSAAGPALQIAVGILIMLVIPLIPGRSALTSSEAFSFALSQFIWVSLFWGLLNLIPIIPLDGGRIFEAIMGPQRHRTALTISLICAVILAISLFVFFGSLFAPLFMGMLAYNNWKQLQNQPQVPWMNVR